MRVCANALPVMRNSARTELRVCEGSQIAQKGATQGVVEEIRLLTRGNIHAAGRNGKLASAFDARGVT